MRYLGACPSEKEMVEQILPDVRLKLECCAVLCCAGLMLLRVPYM